MLMQREFKEGKLIVVELHLSNIETGNVEEEVVKERMTMIKNNRTKMMRFVTEEKGNIVPRACKDAFWNMCNVLNLFYATNDWFTRDTILGIVKDVIYEPLS
ncbi:putative ent-kaurene synthase [Helianthus anomalus]